MIWAFAIITLFYLFLMLFLLFGFGKVPEQRTETGNAAVGFSILVPYRNEAANLPALLSSFKALNYPVNLFEFILVNDNSHDSSEHICQEFLSESPKLQVKLVNSLRKTKSPKKDALETGIGEAKFKFVLTTDADCKVPENWLWAFSSIIRETSADMVSGPVEIQGGKSILSKFQEIDFFSLQAATIGAFGVDREFMCNGANLCYRKDRFLQVQGFLGNEGMASGDDIFLLEKFRAAGLNTVFLKNTDAIVTTNSQPDLKALFRQRIRWAAKTSAYADYFPKVIGVSVFMMNLLLIIGTISWAVGLDVKQLLFLSFLVKFNIDFVLIYRSAHFFGRENTMRNYFWASGLYPFFCCAVVLISGFSGFEWKGRNFRK